MSNVQASTAPLFTFFCKFNNSDISVLVLQKSYVSITTIRHRHINRSHTDIHAKSFTDCTRYFSNYLEICFAKHDSQRILKEINVIKQCNTDFFILKYDNIKILICAIEHVTFIINIIKNR